MDALKEYDMPLMDIELARIRPILISQNMSPHLKKLLNLAQQIYLEVSGLEISFGTLKQQDVLPPWLNNMD